MYCIGTTKSPNSSGCNSTFFTASWLGVPYRDTFGGLSDHYNIYSQYSPFLLSVQFGSREPDLGLGLDNFALYLSWDKRRKLKFIGVDILDFICAHFLHRSLDNDKVKCQMSINHSVKVLLECHYSDLILPPPLSQTHDHGREVVKQLNVTTVL